MIGEGPVPRQRKKLEEIRRLGDVWSLPDEIVPGTVQIHSIGNKELYIENFKSILEYSDCCIRLHTKQGRLCIEGKRLRICHYNRDDMKISGYIQRIQFEI